MNSLYINRHERNRDNFAMYDEALSFYTLYLFSEKSQYYSWISYFVNIWNSRDKWDPEFMINLMHQIDPESTDSSLKNKKNRR